MTTLANKKLAVLIDADNAPADIIDRLLEEVAKYGIASVKRIYGDWSHGLSKWKAALLPHAIIPVQQFAYTKGKNATDMALVIDAMDLLYSGNFDGFCIVSSDSDFTRLASRLRESGLTVYGFGEKKTPEAFRKACDKFIYTEIFRPENNAKKKRKTAAKTPQPPPLTRYPCSNAPCAKTPTTSAGQTSAPSAATSAKSIPISTQGCTATANSPTSSNPSTSSNTAPTTTNSKSAAANPPTSRQRGRLKTRWQPIMQKKPFQTTPTPRKNAKRAAKNQPNQKRKYRTKPCGRHRATDTRQTRTRRQKQQTARYPRYPCRTAGSRYPRRRTRLGAFERRIEATRRTRHRPAAIRL